MHVALDLDGIGTNPGEFYEREVDEYISQKHLKQQGEHSLVTREINEGIEIKTKLVHIRGRKVLLRQL